MVPLTSQTVIKKYLSSDQLTEHANIEPFADKFRRFMNQNTLEPDQRQGPEQRLEPGQQPDPDQVELERILVPERLPELEQILEQERLREADQHLEPGHQFELERILEPERIREVDQ